MTKNPSIWNGGGRVCEHVGCNRPAVGHEPRFSYYYCEVHSKTPPASWKFKIDATSKD